MKNLENLVTVTDIYLIYDGIAICTYKSWGGKIKFIVHLDWRYELYLS